MRDTRRGKIGLLVGVMALVGSIIVPGTVAQSETVRTPKGDLYLHLDNGTGNRYFRFDPAGDDPALTQLINVSGSCQVTGFSPATPELVKLAGGTTSTSNPTLNNVGLANNGLGVRFLNCGRVDAPNWALRLKLGSYIKGLGPNIGIDSADLDLQGWGGVTAVADLYFNGSPTKVGTVTQLIEVVSSGSGREIMKITGMPLFDEIRLRPQSAFDAVALRGGGGDFSDTVFHVVSETTAPSLDITKSAVTPISVGDVAQFNINVMNSGGPASNVDISDSLPNPQGANLTWSTSTNGCSVASNLLTCTNLHLAGGENFSAVVTATTSAAGTLENTVNVFLNDGSTPVDSANASIDVQGPGLNITKIADSAAVAVDSPIGFTITVTNNDAPGIGTAKQVQLMDDLADAAAGVTWSIDPLDPQCEIVNNELGCGFGDMAPGESHSVHITGTGATLADSPIVNKASVTATGFTTPQDSEPASITIFADSLSCTNTEDSVDLDDPSNTATISFENECAFVPYTITFIPAENKIDVQKPPLDETLLRVVVDNWPDELADATPHATIVSTPPSGGGEFDEEEILPCDGTSADPIPLNPVFHSWCLISQSWELVGGGFMEIHEELLLFGDPGARR